MAGGLRVPVGHAVRRREIATTKRAASSGSWNTENLPEFTPRRLPGTRVLQHCLFLVTSYDAVESGEQYLGDDDPVYHG